MKRGTGILTITLLITLVLVSACMMNFGTTKLDFGSSDQAQKALTCFCQTYGDPAAYNGPPRFIAPLVSTELRDNIPVDKVTRFSTDTSSIFFWVIYQNFRQGEDLHLTWQFQGKNVGTITKKTDSRSGIAYAEFVRPDAGWPEGIHTIKIDGNGNSTEVTFYIESIPMERTVFDFSGSDEGLCRDLISYADRWISAQTPDFLIECSPPHNSILLTGTTGPAVAPGTPVQIILFTDPYWGNQDIPPEGILIASTTTKNDQKWEYTWNGDVPGYALRHGRSYIVEFLLPDGTNTKLYFHYVCAGTNSDSWISGQTSGPELSCYPPVNTIRFMGSTGPAVTPGTAVQLKLFNLPDAPDKEILIGSTNTGNDGSWEYTWNGNVPGYMLTSGQEYAVKAVLPNGTYTKVSFLYKCSDPAGEWQIFGRTSNALLSCSPPNNTIRFIGGTGPSVPHQTAVQLKLFNLPDAPGQEILIGSTSTGNDGTWDYSWNGNVPGYTLKNGQEYAVKAMLPWRYTKMSFRYECPGANTDSWISGRLSNPVFTCYPPNNIIQFLGNTGPAVTPRTPVQLKIFNVPDSGKTDLPGEGVLIGSSSTMDDGSWGFLWDGSVEGYGLIQNQDYLVKVLLPDGTYTKIDLPYQCLGTEAPNWWISDNGVHELSCSPPNNTVTFRGKTGSDVPPGTQVTMKLFHMPDAGTREIIIGSTNVRSDGLFEYTWDGQVNGYTFRNGQEYAVKDVLPGGRYTKQSFVYQCNA
jgi:hypothetical protein